MSRTLPATEITTLLGRGSRFEGKLHFEGRVRIDGEFSGEILSDDTLIIAEGASIDGDILAATVIIRGGRVRAEVRATRSIELYVPAEVSGNLRAPEIFIDKGVHFTGTCTMGPVSADDARAAGRAVRDESRIAFEPHKA
jgi:cytoskeletal protein CcmA (bactofilin family)